MERYHDVPSSAGVLSFTLCSASHSSDGRFTADLRHSSKRLCVPAGQWRASTGGGADLL